MRVFEIEAVVVAVKADLAQRFCERIGGLWVRPVRWRKGKRMPPY